MPQGRTHQTQQSHWAAMTLSYPTNGVSADHDHACTADCSHIEPLTFEEVETDRSLLIGLPENL